MVASRRRPTRPRGAGPPPVGLVGAVRRGGIGMRWDASRRSGSQELTGCCGPPVCGLVTARACVRRRSYARPVSRAGARIRVCGVCTCLHWPELRTWALQRHLRRVSCWVVSPTNNEVGAEMLSPTSKRVAATPKRFARACNHKRLLGRQLLFRSTLGKSKGSARPVVPIPRIVYWQTHLSFRWPS